MRKQLKADRDDPDGFLRECRVLSLLNCLEHPNIVELYGSYTCNGVHNLIFPVAEHDLDQLLKSPEAGEFRSEADYLFALCGLASALEKLHTFVSEDLNINLIGCHHDLRPHNILVDNRKFLLADFGLSSLKEVTRGSKTSWKKGDAHYLAPECEDVERDFQPGIIGGKSDIWSFGCILAEVATYITRGARGVKDFYQIRKVTLAERWTVFTFHAGRHPNQGVQTWLADLRELRKEHDSGFIQLVEDMLRIDPDERPSAQMVTRRLRFLAMTSKYMNVSRAFGVWIDQIKSLDMIIEKTRFTLWREMVGVTSTSSRELHMKDNWTNDLFIRQFHNLEKMKQEIELGTEAQRDFHAKTIRLRMINDNMLHILPHESQVKINSYLEREMVDSEDMSRLQELKQTFDETSQYRSIGALAAVKYMHQLCDSPSDGYGRRMQLKSVSWVPSGGNKHYSVGTLRVGDRPPIQALVEHIEYEGSHVNGIGEAMFNRIGAVAELLRTTRSDKNMRVLSPIGYFHWSQNRSFALAFYIPGGPETDQDHIPEIMSLREYMESTQKMKPPLEERILLARRLASALARIHKVKWLHKAISAFGIILPKTSKSDPPIHIPPPYITGFSHSRPSNSFSHLAENSLEMTVYKHPEYAGEGHQVEYQARFDYYSLGMVLLEIGLWRDLSGMTKGVEDLDPEPLLKHILKTHVPGLDFYVGTQYRKIVTRCLVGDVGFDVEKPNESGIIHTDFEMTETVEEQLANCLI